MAKSDGQAAQDRTDSGGRRVALVILTLALLLFVYHMVADRLTPYSSQGYVRAYLVAVAPEVSGLITEVPIRDNQRVNEGDILFKIDSIDYSTQC